MNAELIKKEYEKECKSKRCENLRYLRERIANKTLREFSAVIDISINDLSMLENGDKKLSITHIQSYKDYFRNFHSVEISVDFMMGYTADVGNNVQRLTKQIGLTPQAIDAIAKLNEKQTKTLVELICAPAYVTRLLDNISLYLDSYNVKLTVDDPINGASQTFDREGSALLKFAAADTFSRILDNLFEEHSIAAALSASNYYLQRADDLQKEIEQTEDPETIAKYTELLNLYRKQAEKGLNHVDKLKKKLKQKGES